MAAGSVRLGATAMVLSGKKRRKRGRGDCRKMMRLKLILCALGFAQHFLSVKQHASTVHTMPARKEQRGGRPFFLRRVPSQLIFHRLWRRLYQMPDGHALHRLGENDTLLQMCCEPAHDQEFQVLSHHLHRGEVLAAECRPALSGGLQVHVSWVSTSPAWVDGPDLCCTLLHD